MFFQCKIVVATEVLEMVGKVCKTMVSLKVISAEYQNKIKCNYLPQGCCQPAICIK
jgi:hypothetical protein